MSQIKKFGTDEKGLSQGIHMWTMKALSLTTQSFQNVGLKCQGQCQKGWYWWEGIVTRNRHMKY